MVFLLNTVVFDKTTPSVECRQSPFNRERVGAQRQDRNTRGRPLNNVYQNSNKNELLNFFLVSTKLS